MAFRALSLAARSRDCNLPGLSLAVWSKDGNLLSVCLRLLEAGITICLVSLWLSGAGMATRGLSLSAWSRDDNLWSIFGCLEQG